MLLVEDADFDGWCCHPASEGFAFFLRTYSQVIARSGGDHTAGRKLYHSFLELGIREPHVDLITSVYVAGEGKVLPSRRWKPTAASILAEGLASEDEVNAAIENLATFTADHGSLLAGPRIFQVGSRR